MTKQWSGKTVVVTGGTSLLGSCVTEKLSSLGARVRIASRTQGDVRDAHVCAELLEGADALFHLASQRRNVAYHLEHRKHIFDSNVAMTESLISALGNRKSLPVVFFSTALVSTFPPGTDPSAVPDGYLAAKITCEELWKKATNDLLLIRPVSAYGPRDRFGADANVIPSLMRRCAEAKDELNVWGSGKQKRTFVFAPDVAEATLQLMAASARGVQHLCPPECVSIGELAAVIRDLVRPGLPIRFDRTKPEGPDLCDLPVPQALQSFPWTDLHEGLKRTLQWWRETLTSGER